MKIRIPKRYWLVLAGVVAVLLVTATRPGGSPLDKTEATVVWCGVLFAVGVFLFDMWRSALRSRGAGRVLLVIGVALLTAVFAFVAFVTGALLIKADGLPADNDHNDPAYVACVIRSIGSANGFDCIL